MLKLSCVHDIPVLDASGAMGHPGAFSVLRCDICKKGTMRDTVPSQSHDLLTYPDDRYAGNYPADLYEDKITGNDA
jgi:hypothetical protein